jgi:hypothetical protein
MMVDATNHLQLVGGSWLQLFAVGFRLVHVAQGRSPFMHWRGCIDYPRHPCQHQEAIHLCVVNECCHLDLHHASASSAAVMLYFLAIFSYSPTASFTMDLPYRSMYLQREEGARYIFEGHYALTEVQSDQLDPGSHGWHEPHTLIAIPGLPAQLC